MFDLLSDVYEGMSGTYMGKDWSHCSQLFDLWEVDDPKVVMYFMKVYERIIIQDRVEETVRRDKAEKRKAKSGKNYTHNVQG